MLKITFVFMILILNSALAASHSRIDTLGISKIGHIVALEEYGYKADKHAYYVNIKFLNVWTKKYVGSPIKVEQPARQGIELGQVRKMARELATDQLQKHKISG